MARTLAERQGAHEQSKARLAEAEAKLKLDERRQRTRRLIEAGARVEKVALLELDSNVLYGALLPCVTAVTISSPVCPAVQSAR